MGPSKKTLLQITLFIFIPLLLFAKTAPTLEQKKARALKILELNKFTNNEPSSPLEQMRSKILFHLTKKNSILGLKKYKEYQKELGSHDYPLLREIALMIIEDGISKGTEDDALLSLVALEITGENSLSHLFGKLVKSKHFPVQAKTLSLLQKIHDDHADILIKSYLTSNFITLRLEALSILVQKHHSFALGQVEALMNMVHKHYHPIFVDFFAMSRTSYAITSLKQMMSNIDLNLSLATIIAAKKFRIEELIPNLRSSLTNTSPIIQEGAASALGSFKDSYSKERLELLMHSTHPEVSLAAHFALYELGETNKKDAICKLAKTGNAFAISLLPKIENSKKLLREIYFNDNTSLRINSALSLLELQDPVCLPVINDLITLDPNIYCLQPAYSPGKAFSTLKLIPFSSIDKKVQEHAKSSTLQIQQSLLAKCIDLPRDKCMKVIENIFSKKYNLLIPTAIGILENFNDKEAITFLKEKSITPGAPFIRTSCHLSLWKRYHEKMHQDAIFSWLKEFGKHQMIGFAEKKSDKKAKNLSITEYDLTLEEKSHLLIGAYLSAGYMRNSAGLDCIIDAMIEGHKKNQIPLAGVLLKTIQ